MVPIRWGTWSCVLAACLFILYCPGASGSSTSEYTHMYALPAATYTRLPAKTANVVRHVPRPSLVPIAHVKDEASLVGRICFNPETMPLLSSKGIVALPGDHEQHLLLSRGSVLLAPTNQIKVEVPNAEVSMAPGSIVYIREKDNDTAILNLHDEHMNAVSVRSGGLEVYLPPGRAMILTNKMDADFDDVNPCSGLWYRTVYKNRTSDNVHAFVTQFSTISAAWILPAVRKLALGKTHHSDKLIKTAAAVYQVSRDRKEFRYKLDDRERNPILLVSAKLASEEDQEMSTLETWKQSVQDTIRGAELISLLESATDKLNNGIPDKETLYLRGYLLGIVGCTRWAIADLNKAIELDPQFAQAYKERGICQIDMGNNQAALADLNKAIELDPKSGDALLARGRAYLISKQPKKALPDLRKCAEDSATYVPALPGELPGNYFNAPEFYLSTCYKALGEQVLAEEHMDRAKVPASRAIIPISEYLHRYADKPVEPAQPVISESRK